MTSINQQQPSPNATPETGNQEPEAWTIKRLLEWTTDYFRQKSADQPRLDAEILLAEALGCQRIELYTRFDQVPGESQRTVFREWVQRHGEGEPVAYLVGHREFFSLRFAVNASVLIPRPETEHLVTEALDLIQATGSDADLAVVDVGTGCGNIVVAIACHASEVSLTATDISADALVLAQRNAAAHGQESRITFVHTDLMTDLDEGAKFDLIVSNPPYIGLNEKPSLDRSVVDYEPHQALFAEGAVGTETIARLVEQSVQRLSQGGHLLFEISPMIAPACRDLVEATDSLELLAIKRDLAGLDRMVIAKRR